MNAKSFAPGRLRREWIDISATFKAEGFQSKGRGPWVDLGLCPFHEDHRPSLRGNLATGRLRCMACGWNGDLVDYVQQRYRLSFLDACRRLGSWDENCTPTGQASSIQKRGAR